MSSNTTTVANDAARFGLSEEQITTLGKNAIEAKNLAYSLTSPMIGSTYNFLTKAECPWFRYMQYTANNLGPYSNFRVGAALLTPSGSIITGVNVENASYPVGTCAERCAIGKAVSEGFKEFIAIAVSTDINPPASPCGMCRQFIREFCSLQIPIFMYGSGDSNSSPEYIVKQLEELLPMSFGPNDLLSS